MTVEVASPVDAMRDALVTLAREIGLDGVAVGVAEISAGAIEHLHADERVAIERAVDRRKAEFATGRHVLRSLLSTDQAIVVGAAGRPVVPSGEPVTVAHDDQFAVVVAVLGDHDEGLTIGVDIEPRAPFPVDLSPVVLRPDEIGVDPCLAFCAKEAAYKAWSAAGGCFLEHHDVRVSIEGVRLTAQVVGTNIDVTGAWTIASGRCIVLTCLRR